MINALSETIPYMNSDKYEDRFKAEYYQLTIRMKKLNDFILKIRESYYNSTEEPKHDCPLALLEEQYDNMEEYKKTLEIRAHIEKIDL